MKNFRKGWKLSTKLTLANSISILFVAGMLTIGLYWQMSSVQHQAIQDRLQDILNFSAPQVDGDFHSLIRVPEDETSAFYRVISQRLKSIQETSPIIERIYTLRQLDDGRLIYVVHDDSSMHYDPTTHISIGQDYSRSVPMLIEKLAALPGPLIEDKFYSDETGAYLSGYAPIYDQFRNLDGILGVDINVASIIADEMRTRQIAALIFLITVPLSFLLGAWISQRLLSPVKDLIAGTRLIGNGQFEQTVPVRSRDELGELAGTFNLMAGQLQRSIKEMELEIVKHKEAQKVQDAIYRISQATISTNNMDELYVSIHAILGELISLDNFYIALYDPATDLISFPYYIDEHDEKPSVGEPGRGLTGYVLRTGKPLLATPDIFEELQLQGEVELMGTQPIDWLGVPLKVEDEIIGIMGVQSYSEKIRFSQDNVDLFEFVSSQVAQTIHRKRKNDSLNVSNERYYRLFEESPVSLWEEDFSGAKHILDTYKQQGVTDFHTFLKSRPEVAFECAASIRILDVNVATLKLFKAKTKEDLLDNLQKVFCEESYKHFYEELENLVEGKSIFYQDTVNQTLEGQRIDVSMSWSVQPGYEHDYSRVIVTMIDITERRKNEIKLTYLSTHDALTGLYNRTYFDDAIKRTESGRQLPISIVMADVDDLKEINDRKGHTAGDKMLIQTAKVLLTCFRSEDIIARIGGDEFAIFMPATSEIIAKNAIQRIRENILKSNKNPANPIIRLSLGTSTLEQNGSLEEVLKQADEQMYLDKQNKNNH